MSRLPHNQPQPGPIGQFLGLLSGGILGVLFFVVLSIVLFPVIVGVGLYLLVLQWRLKRAVRRMSDDFYQQFAEAMEQEEGGSETGFRKHVDVTVTDADPEP